MGGFARRSSYWNAFAKKYPAKPFLRLDAGGLFSIGSIESPVVNRWMLEGTFRSNLDALNLSAWDLPAWQELGEMAVAGLVPREFLRLPLVSGNVTVKAANFPTVRRSIIKEVPLDASGRQKFRIGITGLLYDPEGRISGADFGIEDPAAAARAVIAELRTKTDYRVVLADTDVGKAISLAIAVPGINLLVITHDYQALSEPQQVGDTLISILLNEGRVLNEVRLAISPGSDRLNVETRFAPLDQTIPDDPAMAELVRHAQEAAGAAKQGKVPGR